MTIASTFAQVMPGISPGIYAAPDFQAISEIAYREAGIVLPEGKAMMVYSRLASLVRTSGCATFASYVIRIREDAGERMKAIGALTTNHTFFYREAHHFDRKAGAALARQNIRILASDIATHALTTAQAARYRGADLKPVPDALRQAWTTMDGDDAEIAAELRAIVRFRPLNFLEAWPMKGLFDVIFCRNVMIYFDNLTKERLVSRFAEMLTPDGTLYVGHSERVTGPALTQLTPMGPTVYRRKTAA